jgi:hypothetical protein
MSTRVVERVDEWGERSFDGGYRQLQELADREFSGVVRGGGAELYMTNGTVVGVRHGSVESFEDATGTVYEAPTPALPLLAVMQERSEEVRGQYYTEETPISEVDRTLSDGGFTGFVELSENVLSGDYYLVYHGGRSMGVAFVGNTGQLLDGDEAFERTDGEVGIYEVRPVTVEPIEIPDPPEPEPEEQAPDPTGGTADTTEGDEPGGEMPEESDRPEQSRDLEQAGEDDEPAGEADQSAGEMAPESSTDSGEPAVAEAEPGESEPEPGRTADASPGGEEPVAATEQEPGTARTGGEEAVTEPASAETATGASTGPTGPPDAADPREPAERRAAGSDDGGARTRTRESNAAGGAAASEPAGAGASDAVDLETKAIPSLDPERTGDHSGADPRADAPRQSHERAGSGGGQPQSRSRPESATPEQSDRAAEPDPEPRETSTGDDTATDDRVEALEAELSERSQEIQRLEGELEAAESDRDQLQDELESVRADRDDLRAEVERLQEEQARLESEFGVATDAEQRMTAAEALDGTDLFVRYDSKGKATLAKAHDGGTRRTDVDENLRLEKHTQFDAETVSVGGQRYDEFLEGTVDYKFVQWVTRELLFEIRDTGHADGLRTLYDALPKVDRAELDGVVGVSYTEDGEEVHSQESFDVVLRDRMGDPLLVANINDSREAATQSMMERLVTTAERVGQTTDGFAAAFLVTESFFEPAALETASEATRGGLLSRDKRESFVNLSRKRGYHLCLVEARNENFSLAVPEL